MELEYFGHPEAKRKLGNLGTADGVCIVGTVFDTEGRSPRWSSAAAEIRKIIGVKKPT